MAKTAFIVGGGQIGLATGRALAQEGWRVTAAHKGPGPLPPELARLRVAEAVFDRDTEGALARAVGEGVDALVDTVAFDASHARQLLALQSRIGALVVISSASVYRDEAGRTLDEAAENGFPRFPEPIGEDQPTVAPGPQTYSTRKVALEQGLLQNARAPVILLRPGAIHGAGSRHPREWWFVKRILDDRGFAPLAYRGQSRFHTSAARNIAELIRVALAAPAIGILNAADPAALSVREIGRTIAGVYGADLTLVEVDGPPNGGVGATPWSIPRPLVLDMGRAVALGYRPVATYEEAAPEACRAAEAAARAGVAFPDYITAMFDYAAEDAWRAAKPVSPS
ncbi:MAG: Rossmann-fold NAD(P)-binding domain-containing protein [Caulobacteraceae bacterium]